MVIVSAVFGRALSRTTGGTQTAVTSSAIGQTTTWPSVAFPIAKDIVELDGSVMRIVTLRGKLITEIDLTDED